MSFNECGEIVNELAIRVRNVSKIYRLWNTGFRGITNMWKNNNSARHLDFYALNDVSFDIYKGESWGIIGVNGSGKSTLLKIIAGNLRPSIGYVDVEGAVAILDYGIGFNEDFTGKDNIFLKATLLGLTKKQIQVQYASIVEFAEIGDFIDQPVKTYSSGMRARLGFAIMAHVSADILIADEALAVGDIFFVQKCMRFLRTFVKQRTFIFVSHATNDILSLCQKAVWLEKGKIKAIGSAAVVVRAYLDNQTLSLGDEDIPIYDVEKTPQTQETVKSEFRIEQPLLGKLMDYQPPRACPSPYSLDDVYLHNEIQIVYKDIYPTTSIAANIVNVSLYGVNDNTTPIFEVLGGEKVALVIKVLAQKTLESPIVGFQVMNQSGQVVFADNSNLITRDQTLIVKAGTTFAGEFVFHMPLLVQGDYALRAAVAIGEERSAILLQTLDQSLIFRSVVSRVSQGLIGVPMHDVELTLEVSS